MTLPVLVQNHRNKVVETRLKKFYTTINQAIKMSELENGDKKYWFSSSYGADFDDEGHMIAGTIKIEEWFNKYLAPYIKTVKQETLSDRSFIVYFADGSAMRFYSGTMTDIFFYPGSPEKCWKRYNNSKYNYNIHIPNGKCQFAFGFSPFSTSPAWKYHYDKGIEPYKFAWNGDVKKLRDGSRYACTGNQPHYCTTLIQQNNWTIPKDYPYRVSY